MTYITCFVLQLMWSVIVCLLCVCVLVISVPVMRCLFSLHLLSVHLWVPGGCVLGGLVLNSRFPRLGVRRYAMRGGSGASLFIVSDASKMCLCSRWNWWRLGAWGQKVLIKGVLFRLVDAGVFFKRVFLSREWTLVMMGAMDFFLYPLLRRWDANSEALLLKVSVVLQIRRRRRVWP